MSFGEFTFPAFISTEDRDNPGEVDNSVFHQVQSPSSIVHSLPSSSNNNSSSRLHSSARLSSGSLPGTSGHSPSSVEEFRRPAASLQSAESIVRRLNRRHPPPSTSSGTPGGRSIASTGSGGGASASGSESPGASKDALSRTMARVWFERNADKAYGLLKKESSAQRMKNLRKYLDYLDDTEWYYTPVDQLIGQY